MKFEEKKIIDICSFSGGSQPPKSTFIHEPKEGYIRLIQIRDRLNDDYITFIPEELARKTCESTDILIGRYGPPIFQVFRGFKGAYNVALLKATPKEGIDSDYLFYFLQQKSILHYVEKMAMRTAGQWGVDIDGLNEYPVKLPSLDDQKKLARILLSLDERIETNNKIIHELKVQANDIYNYWFTQFDFPAKDNKPYKSNKGCLKYNSIVKRDIPNDWDILRIKDLCVHEKDTITPIPEKLYAHFSLPGFDANGTYEFEYGESILSDKFNVVENDIIISKLNPWSDRTQWVGKIENSVCSTEYVVLRSSNIFEQAFIYQLAHSFSFIDYCTRGASGTSHSHRRVSPDYMLDFPIPYNKDVIEKFGKIILPMIKNQVLMIQENQELSKLKDELLPLLMNGQVSVK